MKIAFVVLVKDEVAEFARLMDQLTPYVVKNGDEIIVVSDIPENEKIKASIPPSATYVVRALNGDFGDQRNAGDAVCSADVTHIFHIDADETLHPTLLEMLRAIIESNPGVELFDLARVNIVRGITERDVEKWGWSITKNDDYVVYNEAPLEDEYRKFLSSHGLIRASTVGGSDIYYLPIINFPDYQARLYVRDSARIRWDGLVHEHVVGERVKTRMPQLSSFAIIHDKTITRQRKQNALYDNIIAEWRKNLAL